jgi:hypothetical protein
MAARTMLLVALMMLGWDVTGTYGHDLYRIVGKIERYHESTLDVKDREGKTTSIRVDKQTEVTRDNKKVETRELQLGRSVVVEATGDSEADLLALEIRLVPDIKPTPKKK